MARGRPRKCDPDDVLDIALNLFWKRGYAATSMNDVARETGMAKPGLYANFASKDQLFEKSLRSYCKRFSVGHGAEFLTSDKPISDAVRDLLRTTAEALLTKSEPSGCFLVNTVLETAGEHSAPYRISREMSEDRDAVLEQRIRRAQEEGEMPSDIPPRRIVGFLSAQLMAIGAMVGEGRGQEDINGVIDMAVTALPLAGR